MGRWSCTLRRFVTAFLIYIASLQIARAVPLEGRFEDAKLALAEARTPLLASFSDSEDVARQSSHGDTPLAARIEKFIQSVRQASGPKQIRAIDGGVQEVSKVPKTHGNFELVVPPFWLDSGPVQVAVWRSKITKMTVVWVGTKSSSIYGDLTFATEVFNDSGLPHTLEHLTFLGSKRYPDIGVLEAFSSRGLGTGLSAYTDLTHTNYWMSGISESGFLRTLPVFMDHVFFPTLKPEMFTTEVYHVNEDGKEAGTAFNEMQAGENTEGDLLYRCMKKELFPEGSAYRSVSGGLMEGLRNLKMEKIRDYHAAYYHPQNLQVCVAGDLDPKSLLSVLQDKVEPTLIEEGRHLPPANWKRPFLETASRGGPRLTTTRTVEIEFPSEDEVSGTVQLNWIGAPTTDSLRNNAHHFLLRYMVYSRDSPLAKRFLECEPPKVSNIRFEVYNAEKNIWSLTLDSVPQDEMRKISSSVLEALKQETPLIDIKRMGQLIEKETLSILDSMEVNPAGQVLHRVLRNHVYGDDRNLVTSLSETFKRYKTLANWSQSQWAQEFKTWFLDKPSLRILARPSSALKEKLQFDVPDLKRDYGPEKLKELGQKLSEAQILARKPIPSEVLSKIPLSSDDSIKRTEAEIARGDGSLGTALEKIIDARDPVSLPMFVQFQHYNSKFVHISVVLTPKSLPDELLPLLPIYYESFFALPIKRHDGSTLSYNQVIQLLDALTISHQILLNSQGAQTISVMMRFEASKYSEVIELLRDLLWGSIFEVDRLDQLIAQEMKVLPDLKRDTEHTGSVLLESLLFTEKSLYTRFTYLKEEKEFPKLQERLRSDRTSVIEQLEELRSHLLKPENFKIGVWGDIHNLEKPKSAWIENFPKMQPATPNDLPSVTELLSEDGAHPSGRLLLIHQPTSKSSYSVYYTQVPVNRESPEYPALIIAIKLINSMNSFLWKGLRHLAYSHFLSIDVSSGLLQLSISHAPDAWKAFEQARNILQDHAEVNEEEIKTLKSVLIGSYVNLENSDRKAADIAFRNTALLDLPMDYYKVLCEKIKKVTTEEVLSSIKKYVLPIFDPKTSGGIVGAPSESFEKTLLSFQSESFRVERKSIDGEQIGPVMKPDN